MPEVAEHNHDLRYYRRPEIDYRFQPSYLLAKIKSVDGPASGLDADTLDGSHASAFAASSHTHDDRYYTETEADARYGRLAAANTWTVNNSFSPTLAAGTYGLSAFGAAGAARDIFLAGEAGYSDGFTVQYTGSAMQYVFRDGNVGIGTTSPSGKLEVLGASGYNSILFDPNTDGYGVYVRTAKGAYATAANLYLDPDSGIVALIDGTNSFTISVFNAVTESISLKANGDSWLNGGNVGIGTASPQRKLHVAGTILVDGDEGGYAGTVGLTDVTAGAGGFANGTVKMAGVTGRNSVGWLKIYVGTTAYYIPYWDDYT